MIVATSRLLLWFRRAAALTAVSAAGLSGVSCVTYPPPGGGNVFLEENERPRYGYGGVESPNARPENRPAPPPSRPQQPSSEPKKTPSPAIKRDPSNTTVDLTPPPPKEKKSGEPADREAPSSSSSESGNAQDAPPPPKEKTPPAREDLPFGQPIIGRPGFVYSPYAPTQVVNVEGLPSGTKVECPYTKKHFRVP